MPWRPWGFGKPPGLALCSEQGSPLQISPSPPTAHGAGLCLLATQASAGTRAHRHRLFLNGDHRDPLGEGQPQVRVSSQPPKELQPLGPSFRPSCPHQRPETRVGQPPRGAPAPSKPTREPCFRWRGLGWQHHDQTSSWTWPPRSLRGLYIQTSRRAAGRGHANGGRGTRENTSSV